MPFATGRAEMTEKRPSARVMQAILPVFPGGVTMGDDQQSALSIQPFQDPEMVMRSVGDWQLGILQLAFGPW